MACVILIFSQMWWCTVITSYFKPAVVWTGLNGCSLLVISVLNRRYLCVDGFSMLSVEKNRALNTEKLALDRSVSN